MTRRTKNPSSWTVVAGEHDASISEGHEVEVSVNRIFVNGYDDFTRTNDIALILLDEPLPDDNDWINEICMPTAADIPAVGDVCYLMGWGYLSNGNSQNVKPLLILIIIMTIYFLHTAFKDSRYVKIWSGLEHEPALT